MIIHFPQISRFMFSQQNCSHRRKPCQKVAFSLLCAIALSAGLPSNAQPQAHGLSPNADFLSELDVENPGIPGLNISSTEDGGGTTSGPGTLGTHVFEPLPIPLPDAFPGRRNAGPSRGDCPVVDIPLTALVPEVVTAEIISGITVETSTVWGYTTESNPTLWFYVPYALNNDEMPAIFRLMTEDNQELYSTTVFGEDTERSITPGITAISLPEDEVALQVDEQYRWTLRVDCEGETPIFVEGWIQRVEALPEIQSQSPLVQASIFAQNGIWYDAVDRLAELRQDNPNDPDLMNAWTELLESVGLNAIAPQPFAQSAPEPGAEPSIEPVIE